MVSMVEETLNVRLYEYLMVASSLLIDNDVVKNPINQKAFGLMVSRCVGKVSLPKWLRNQVLSWIKVYN